ncbi:beta-keto acid cleavage enzyme [compost metagenome]
MVDQIRQIDPDATIAVCAAGRSTLYMTTVATMLGLNIRVGTEDTPWKYPNSDELLTSNLEMFAMARDIAGLLGRRPASADEYRRMIGKPARS